MYLFNIEIIITIIIIMKKKYNAILKKYIWKKKLIVLTGTDLI